MGSGFPLPLSSAFYLYLPPAKALSLKKHLLLPFFFLIITTCIGQTRQERVHITGGSELWQNFTKEMFQYPSFRQGVVTYRNGQVFERAMNYNKVLETIQFIDEKNDTLAIANEGAVKDITIGEDVFVFLPVCYQVLAPAAEVKLYKHEKMRIADIRRKGLYGIPNTSAAIESLNQVYSWMSSYQLDVNELLLLSKTTEYYIMGENEELIPAGKKNVLRRFPGKQKQVTEYVNAHSISFSKEEDLVKLVKFISGER